MHKIILIKPENDIPEVGMVCLGMKRMRHLSFGKGELDFSYLLGCFMSNNSEFITIETTRLYEHSLHEDVLNVKFWKNMIENSVHRGFLFELA